MAAVPNKLDEKPDMVDLLNRLGEVEHMWHPIGTMLRVDRTTLGGLGKSNRPDNERLEATLEAWFARPHQLSPVTWHTIITALSSNHVKQNRLADEIQNSLSVAERESDETKFKPKGKSSKEQPTKMSERVIKHARDEGSNNSSEEKHDESHGMSHSPLPPTNTSLTTGIQFDANDEKEIQCLSGDCWKILPKELKKYGTPPENSKGPYQLKNIPFGYCIVINIENFEEDELPRRLGSDNDKMRIAEQFTNHGFCTFTAADLREQQILDKLEAFKTCCVDDCKKISCLAVIFMSHGDCLRKRDFTDINDRTELTAAGQGVVFSADNKRVKVKTILNHFLEERRLENIPKLFIIQACRGGNTNKGTCIASEGGMHIESEGGARAVPPFMADTLLAFPTPMTFVAWRNTYTGSFFIQKLCDILEDQKFENEDFYTILTEVAQKIVSNQSELKDKAGNPVKDMPNFTSFLQYKLMLPRIPKKYINW